MGSQRRGKRQTRKSEAAESDPTGEQAGAGESPAKQAGPAYPLLEPVRPRGLSEAASPLGPGERLERSRRHRDRLRDQDRRRLAAAAARGPLDFRRQHKPLEEDAGPAVERLAGQIPDAQQRPGNPYRAYDTLAALRRNGSIGEAQLAAGRRFEEDFALARLNSLHARDLSRVGGRASGRGASGGSGQDLPDAVLAAKRRVHKALALFGGQNSGGGSALWEILGEGKTIKDYALSRQPGGSVDQKNARGTLVCALEALAE